jgi:predicted TIM-barrel fold metal-dependent hydrolase
MAEPAPDAPPHEGNAKHQTSEASRLAANSPWIISADDHVVEPANLWTDRLPRAMRSRAPRVVRERVANNFVPVGVDAVADAGELRDCDVWYYDDIRKPVIRNFAAVGLPPDDVDLSPMTFEEMRPGCYDPRERLRDMDLNRTEAALCFPNLFVRFCGQTFLDAKDKELASQCVQAYNDWLFEEWCAADSSRLVGATIVPLWDPVAAAAEIRRNADRGGRVVAFSELPGKLGLPSIHTREWDPLLAACDETATVIALHIGSGSVSMTTSPDAPLGVVNALTHLTSTMALTDWLLSGNFARFPHLKLLLAEAQLGWIPFSLERMDWAWEHNRGWTGLRHIPDPPSSYFAGHVSAAFFSDPHGVRSIPELGAGNVLFEVDYPHADSTWPHTSDIVEEIAKLVQHDTLERIVHQNARELLQLGERRPASTAELT